MLKTYKKSSYINLDRLHTRVEVDIKTINFSPYEYELIKTHILDFLAKIEFIKLEKFDA